MNLGPEITAGAEMLVKLIASKGGYQLDAGQIAEAAGKLIGAVEGALNAWPEAKKAGEAAAGTITDTESAEKWNKEH